MQAELFRLRAEVADARTAATSEGISLPNRLQEDFVSNTIKEAALWMRCRQQEMEKGSEGDVSRLTHVIAEGAVQLRQWTQPPSSVVNMVN